jgi:inositol-phosphate phosphatase / L-galactose 1-phosphate phosphatase / histidinol-phosphatase
VVEGAGGIMTDWAGNALHTGSGPRVIAAGDRRTHAEALSLLGADRVW